VKSGNNADLRDLPIVRHHEMDGGPYIDMTVAMRDPDQGFYNASFHRTQYKEPQKLGIHLSPRHNWTILRKNEERNLPTPVAIIVSHHPAFYLGALNVAPFGVDDYELIGGIMNESSAADRLRDMGRSVSGAGGRGTDYRGRDATEGEGG